MTIADRSRVDLREVLRTTCAASPVEAIDVMADGLATLTGATYVEFLITNITHRAVVRFAGSGANAARVRQEDGAVPVVPLRGTVYDQVLRRQQMVRMEEGGGERILVPVTETGDALGVIDLHLPRGADAVDFADIAAVAEALARIVIASRRHSDLPRPRPAVATAAAPPRRPHRPGHRRDAGAQRGRPRPARHATARGGHSPPRAGLRARGDRAACHRRRAARRRHGAVSGLARRPRSTGPPGPRGVA